MAIKVAVNGYGKQHARATLFNNSANGTTIVTQQHYISSSLKSPALLRRFHF